MMTFLLFYIYFYFDFAAMNQFDYEREGRALTQKALGILERPVEIPNEDPFK